MCFNRCDWSRVISWTGIHLPKLCPSLEEDQDVALPGAMKVITGSHTRKNKVAAGAIYWDQANSG